VYPIKRHYGLKSRDKG